MQQITRSKSSIYKQIFEDVLGVALSLYVIYSIFPSTIDDVSFLFVKNETSAEIMSISRNGTSKNPIILNIKYLEQSVIKQDRIFTNEKIAPNLQKGQMIEICYGGFFDEKTYIIDHTPGLFVMLVQVATIFILLLVLIASSKRLLIFFRTKITLSNYNPL